MVYAEETGKMPGCHAGHCSLYTNALDPHLWTSLSLACMIIKCSSLCGCWLLFPAVTRDSTRHMLGSKEEATVIVGSVSSSLPPPCY